MAVDQGGSQGTGGSTPSSSYWINASVFQAGALRRAGEPEEEADKASRGGADTGWADLGLGKGTLPLKAGCVRACRVRVKITG